MHVHTGRTNKHCTNSAFELTGLCDNFKKCLDTHKFDSKKFGPLKNFKQQFVSADPRQIVLRNAEVMMIDQCALSMMVEECEELDMTDLRHELEFSCGMSVSEVEEYTAQNTDLLKAIMMSESASFYQESQPYSRKPPYVMLMIDGGTFRHMIGSNALQYMTNVCKVKPYPLKTAGGIVWLNEVADLAVSSHVFKQCMVNPNINTSLLSQGIMTMEEGWEFTHAKRVGGLRITDPAGQVDLAHSKGVLSYLPSYLLGPEFGEKECPYSCMTDSETAQQWCLMQDEQDEDSDCDDSKATTVMLQDPAAFTVRVDNLDEICRLTIEEHILKVHSTTPKHGKCKACLMGKVRAT